MVVETLPLALAIAASPFPVIPAILVLFTARPRATSLAFLAGWVAGILAAVVVFVLLAEVIETREQSPTWVSWGRLLLGLTLVVVGVRQWRGRADAPGSPAWMRSVEQADPARAVRLALALSVPNPKILLLAAAGGMTIGAAEISGAATALTVLGFTAVSAISVAIPVLAFAALGKRALGPLTGVKGWLERNNAVLMAVVVLVIGLALAVKGLTELVAA